MHIDARHAMHRQVAVATRRQIVVVAMARMHHDMRAQPIRRPQQWPP
jgi:hypothetical protein